MATLRILNSVLVDFPPALLFRTLRQLEELPHLVKGIERVAIKSKDAEQTSLWGVSIKGTKMQWSQKDEFQPDQLSHFFSLVDGQFERLEGSWRITQANDSGTKSRLTLEVLVEPKSIPLETEVFEARIRLAIRWALREIRRKMSDQRAVFEGQEPSATPSTASRTIVSELVSYSNRRGLTIIGFYDHLLNAEPQRDARNQTSDFVIIPSGYGETKNDCLMLSYCLVKNGFHVLRYDNTDHLGESDGLIANTTLPKMKDDLIATLDFCERRFGITTVGVVASSLAHRVAIKAATEDRRIGFLLGLVGVVDIQATLRAVYSEDIIGRFLSGDGWDKAEILGFEVTRSFPESAIRERYHDLESTQKDVKKITIPIVFIAAEQDAWVNIADIKLVFESTRSSNRELHILSDTMHQIHENPVQAKNAIRLVITKCLQHMRNKTISQVDLQEPRLREIAEQNRIEKERLRYLHPLTSREEKQFWEQYLGHFGNIIKSREYRNYLSLLDVLLGEPRYGEFVADVGCGNGHFGSWLLASSIMQLQDNQSSERKSLINSRNYIGVDYVETALMEARCTHQDMIDTSIRNGLHRSPFRCSYILADANASLPFRNGQFDKICCSLLLSYTYSPIKTLQEVVRLLKPGGRIVISSLKPHADLSVVYRNFVSSSESSSDFTEARSLLNAAGQIKQRVGEGHFHFFSRNELVSLFKKAPVSNLKIYRSFGDQINILSAEKC